jgi:exopolyphosphatase/guanosine-5'-triphosphate,3'-diphosphate pyrophosphatase
MEPIIPRWEWRTFAASFGDADQRFAALEPGRVQESDEVYLLSPHTDANVKIRDRLMDIKTLEQVNADGLEQWRPVMKGDFPLPAVEVATVCVALGVAAVSGREAYTLEQLQAELMQPSRGVRAVQVHKRRLRYTINGCTAEMTDVVVDGKPTRTVAIELEDAARVLAAVREMALDGFENISYPRGLKRLLGLRA